MNLKDFNKNAMKRIARSIKSQGEYYTEQGIAPSVKEDVYEMIYTWMEEGLDGYIIFEKAVAYCVDRVGLVEQEAEVIVEKLIDEANSAI